MTYKGPNEFNLQKETLAGYIAKCAHGLVLQKQVFFGEFLIVQSQLLLSDIGHLSGKYHAWPTIMEPA